METIAEYTGLKIPDWALSYIVNADDSGITPEDKKLVDDYMKQFGTSYIFECSPENYYFSWNPEFGLACNVVDCTILIVK